MDRTAARREAPTRGSGAGRFVLMLAALSLSLAACGAEDATAPFDYERDTPAWLKVKIDSISESPGSFGTTVYRYEWRGEFVYHIEIPVSSCAYCELYDRDGTRLRFPDSATFEDFLATKRNQIVIWKQS